MLRIKLVRSLIGQNPRNRATVAALGLRKMQQVVLKEDTPVIRGMVHHVKHMLSVEVVEGGEAPKKSTPKGAKKAAAPKPAAVAAEAPVAEAKPKAAPKKKAEAAPAEAEKPKRTTKAKKSED